MIFQNFFLFFPNFSQHFHKKAADTLFSPSYTQDLGRVHRRVGDGLHPREALRPLRKIREDVALVGSRILTIT